VTYAQAREQVLACLASRGWKVATRDQNGRALKVPHATSPDGWLRLWFKPQAVHFTEGNQHSAQHARSLWVDIRHGGPTVVDQINRAFKRSY